MAVAWRMGVALIVGALTGCALRGPAVDPTADRPLPDRFSSAVEGEFVERWWTEFGDPTLSALIEKALAENLDLRKAWARLDQAAQLARQAGADRWPQVSLEGGAQRSRAVAPSGPTPGDTVTTDLVQLRASASYEIDLWGRVASQARAAAVEVSATRNDLNAAAMTLAAETARLWFELQEQTAQLELLHRQARASLTYLQLTESRFATGLASLLDVYQQRQQEASIRLRIPESTARIQTLQHQIAILLAVPPTDLDLSPSGDLPDLPPPPPTGLPADLLERRPDIRAALNRLEAADARVAVAVANRLPALRLTGVYGFQDDGVEDLFRNWLWNLAAGLTAPLIDGQRRAAEVERTRAAVREQIAGTGQIILTALREVEDALVNETHLRQTLELQRRQSELARATLDQSRLRYLNGLSEYLPVLLAIESQQTNERNVVAAQRALLSARLQLYRALGGAWTDRLQPPRTDSPETPRS